MGTANVLVVCRGNVRRSQAIAAMLADGTSATLGLAGTGVTVTSAGTEAAVGETIDPILGKQLVEFGIRPSQHGAVQLQPYMVERADIVITASRSHRAVAAHMVPSAARRLYTLRELAALASLLDESVAFHDCEPSAVDRLRRLAEVAPLARGSRLELRGRMDDVRDPTRMTSRSAVKMIKQVQEPVEVLLRLLIHRDGVPWRGMSVVTSRAGAYARPVNALVVPD